ncbi:MAG: hypothetical protein K2N31_09780 [Treponemataceae bacterium]|nr:hypothetical protein [Treponemataceae bacterium]
MARAAGISLFPCGDLYEKIREHYDGSWRSLCAACMLSERMFRAYRRTGATKQALLAVCVFLSLGSAEADAFLSSLGWRLSPSLAQDCIVAWFLDHRRHEHSRTAVLDELNELFGSLGIPRLMTQTGNFFSP